MLGSVLTVPAQEAGPAWGWGVLGVCTQRQRDPQRDSLVTVQSKNLGLEWVMG